MLASVSPSAAVSNKLEYLLQVSLCATTAKLKEAILVSNPNHALAFEKRSKDCLIIETWIDCSYLTGVSSYEEAAIQKLNSSNISVPTTGFRIKSKLALKDKISEINTKVKKCLVFCKVAVGRSVAISEEEIGKSKKLPDGYDSFVLSHKDGSALEYVVKSFDQILPMYLTVIEFDPVLEKRSRERPVCDNCERVAATVYCSADAANLCNDCDENIHNANRLMQKHQRTSIGKGPDSFGKCRAHDERIEYFCSQCYLPVCVHCKMVGHHSQGEASKHKLIRVMEAFETVLKDSVKRDSFSQDFLSRVEKQDRMLENRFVELDKMQMGLEEELTRKFEAALMSLKSAVTYKKSILLADKLELCRMKSEIEDLEKFLKYQQTSADLYPLLFTWSTHQTLRQEMKEFNTVKEKIDVFADLKVEGNLNIKQDPSKRNDIENNERDYDVSSSISTRKTKNMPLPSVPNSKEAANLFAETLNILDNISHERVSAVNKQHNEETHYSLPGFEKLGF